MSDEMAEDWILVNRDQSPSKASAGIVYVEARFRDDYKEMTIDADLCSRLEVTINEEFVALELWKELIHDDTCSDLFPKSLVSVKAVEYTGRDLPASSTLVPLRDGTKARVQLYQMHTDSPKPDEPSYPEALLNSEITPLPCLRFENLWEKLIFDEDLRNGLVLTLTNMVKFGQRLGSNNSQMNRLVLLYGPPGTGKSSLCVALAQKISIRLQKRTELIQINAATLLSKYFSESASQIHKIFATIEKVCKMSPDLFVCVLIDEIESLAASRTAAAGRNEAHDSIRATNALLTSFDRVRSQPNIIILCTSNLVKTLDAAFMDRCGLVMAVDTPSIAAAYEIVRGGLKKLIEAKIIESESDIPSFRDAQMTLLSKPEEPSSKLFKIVEELTEMNRNCLVDGMVVSGRFLGQLAEQALSRSLREDSCTLQKALDLIKTFVLSQSTRGKKRKFQDVDGAKDDRL